MRAFLFGSGWWTAWHLFVLAFLLPCAGLTWWLATVKPGAGPQGGEFAAMLLLLFLLGWTVVSLVHAMLWAAGIEGTWSRFLKAALLWLLAWGFVAWGLYKLTDLAASDSAGLVARRAGLAGFVALVLAMYAAHLTFLARVRAR